MNCIKSYKTNKDIKTSTIKFAQSWDAISKYCDGFTNYTRGDFYPCLEELGIKVAGEWEVIIGDRPRINCEGRADDTHNVLARLQSSRFQKARKGLKQLVENYESRILTFHIQKTNGCKSQRYQFVAG